MRRTVKETALYNVMFPIWFLLIFPLAWIIVLPVNFIIDSVVLLIGVKLLKTANTWGTYKRSILRVWLIGFASDFIGAGILFLSSDGTGGWYEYLRSVSWNPFDNWYALLFVAFAVAISGISIYFGNLKYSLAKTELSYRNKRILALILAIFTAPYILFYPSSLLNGSSWDDLKFMTNHIVKNDEFRLEVAMNRPPSDDSSGEAINMYRYQHDMADAINEAEKTAYDAGKDPGQPDFTLLFYKRDYSAGKEIPVWIDKNRGYFQYGDTWYLMEAGQIAPFLRALTDAQNTRGKKEFVIIPDPGEDWPDEEPGRLDQEKISEYPVFQDSRNRYYCPDRRKFDGGTIQFEGRERIDIHTALESGLVTPQDLIDRGMELIIEERK